MFLLQIMVKMPSNPTSSWTSPRVSTTKAPEKLETQEKHLTHALRHLFILTTPWSAILEIPCQLENQSTLKSSWNLRNAVERKALNHSTSSTWKQTQPMKKLTVVALTTFWRKAWQSLLNLIFQLAVVQILQKFIITRHFSRVIWTAAHLKVKLDHKLFTFMTLETTERQRLKKLLCSFNGQQEH